MDYRLHDVIWTDDKVGRFWDYENNERKFQGAWFTFQVGDGVWNFTKRFIPKKAKILDYSAGKGFLSKRILEESTMAVDCAEFSGKGLQNIEHLISHYPNFGRVIPIQSFPIDAADHSYDAVYFVEAIEHLTDNYYLTTLTELKRLIKYGGILIITTRNNENLDENLVCCPDCGCVFHRVQHIRSFTPKIMTSLMESLGFITLYCRALNFSQYKDKLKLSTKIIKFVNNYRKDIKQPHLVYIGKLL